MPDAAFHNFLTDFRVTQGQCLALVIFDIGHAIDLGAVESRLSAATGRRAIQRERPAPSYFDFTPRPLKWTTRMRPLTLGDFRVSEVVEVLLYDFGAISYTFRIDLNAALTASPALARSLYGAPQLNDAARALARQLLDSIEPVVRRPGVSDLFEEYVIYQLTAEPPVGAMDDLLQRHAQPIARLLRAEAGELSQQEAADALACRISYGVQDATLVDWNAALVLDREADDVLAVLEFANVQLLESRFLDARLDRNLDESYVAMTRRGWRVLPLRRSAADFRRITEQQIEGVILFEGVNNALKLLGDQYLARLYRLAAQRFHLSAWQESIQRKLETLSSLSARIAERQSASRLEVLEWIVILLIAAELWLGLMR